MFFLTLYCANFKNLCPHDFCHVIFQFSLLNTRQYDMVHPLIEAEIGKVKQIFGENSVEFR